MTFDYLKQRKQFGKLIGEFQALQHRAAHLYGEIEIARAAALKAAQLLDAGDPRAELMIAVAKAKAARVAALAVQEGVQMHGGIGMTDEHDIGLYMKREAVLDRTVRRSALPCRRGGAAERLLRPSSRKLIRAAAIGLARSVCQASASTLAMRLPSRSIVASAKVSPAPRCRRADNRPSP